MMRIAIVHYHLRPGGVTKVIQHSLAALRLIAAEETSAASVRPVVVTGEPPSPTMPVAPCLMVEELGYDTSSHRVSDAAIADVEGRVKQALGGTPDIWHIHNHALGKNLMLPALVAHLVRQGQPLLLQLHDFAEDGRPKSYKFLCDSLGQGEPKSLGACLYPQGAHVHYALINQRDLNFLRNAGVNPQQLHYLPDAVSLESAATSESETAAPAVRSERLFLYPGRAIRRKNLGEFLLWAAMAEKGERFAVTRAPKNPLARPIYNDWVRFAQAFNIPVEFEASKTWPGDFTALLKSAYALATTSVAEGFGLAFLEPWLIERPLVGRNLPEITDALAQAGIDLSTLYHQVTVPVEWIGRDRFRQEVQIGLARVFEAYGRPLCAEDVERAVNAAITDRRIDFGRLNEGLQQAVIERLVRSPSLRQAITPSAFAPTAAPLKMIRQNRRIVETQFNLREYGKHLRRIYQAVAHSQPASFDPIRAEVLLDHFLAPERFCLLRT